MRRTREQEGAATILERNALIVSFTEI